MATYTYRCATDGSVDVQRPIGTAPASVPCPRCGTASPRVITAPMLGLGDRGRMAVIDRAERSRTEPEVVTSLPGTGRPARPAPALEPRTRGLPRP
ncbi:zinc ribbon domain-containing protein [Pseudonocardia sp. C8]|uniref:zinc ribbon domain-containing protein n=1 Tax=Pseudonocardia sp. C8 TaxID=2762759 RepID=UPI001642BEF0|nr:zinc ribbon domain-containing protein [Pseudonocardia sp. C8]MBC3194478.1 zinc ribbon domain-containing protein [Pseudonocardia sp. C8]